MKDALRHRLDRLAIRLPELDAALADPAVAADINQIGRASCRERVS
jgi:hypothetical protein